VEAGSKEFALKAEEEGLVRRKGGESKLAVGSLMPPAIYSATVAAAAYGSAGVRRTGAQVVSCEHL